MYTTLDVAGERRWEPTQVDGDVSVTGNVSAADATAANHLASKGQMDAADDELQTNINANATADAAQALRTQLHALRFSWM